MIAFDVFLNRKKLARAGIGSDGVLTAMTTWVRRRRAQTDRNRRQPQWDRDLSSPSAGTDQLMGKQGNTLRGKIESSSLETFSRSR